MIFENKIEDGEFFEYANVHGNYYGTLNSEIDKYLKNGIDIIILEIDVRKFYCEKKRKRSELNFYESSNFKRTRAKIKN